MIKNIQIQLNPDELQDLMKEAISDYFFHNPANSFQTQEKLMTIREAAQFLKCSIQTIYGKVSKKEIPFHKQGKRLYFSERELTKWIKHEL